GITTGGKLQEFLEVNNFPKIIIDPSNNPGNMPRFALGYAIMAEIKFFVEAGVIKENVYSDDTFLITLEELKSQIPTIKEIAKNMASKLKDKAICLVAGGHLGGNGKTFVNQVNESSKMVAFSAYLPEADHNLVESFTENYQYMKVFLMKSNLFSEKLKKRFEITSKLIENSGYELFSYETKSTDKLFEAIEYLLFTSYLSVYMATEKGVDPLSIPSIDFIKANI
ncbi:SIS domain-containing protein, partial [Patescibacteria group bacterium]